ncbi:MAG: DUF1376 domain-containing protein [Caulobacteraceae bacterium]|nr:DUF1376 domain-containing protein [Caulobacteraceae bacterium]
MASSWFPMFGRDFIAATLGWSAEERGHYVTLLIAQWEQGEIPADVKRLELISPGVSRVWKTLEPKFPKSTGGKLKNRRLEHERHLAHERSTRARQSASARWAAKAAADAQEVPEQCPEQCSGQCVEQCDRICDRICSDDASMSMSYSPPPPPPPPAAFGEDWGRLRDAWNAAWGEKRQWRSAEPPPEAIARLGEPGWLEDALKAIPGIKAGLCAGFKTPPGLRQFCGRDDRGSFVARLLGGEFVDEGQRRRRPQEA